MRLGNWVDVYAPDWRDALKRAVDHDLLWSTGAGP